jgi:hypothetical protein
MSTNIGTPGGKGIGNSRGGYAPSTVRFYNTLTSMTEASASVVGEGFTLFGNCNAASSFGPVYWENGLYSSAIGDFATAGATTTSWGGSLEFFWKAGVAPGSGVVEGVIGVGANADTDKMSFCHDGVANAFYFRVFDGLGNYNCSATDADCAYTASGDVIHFGIVWASTGELQGGHTAHLYANNNLVGVCTTSWTPGKCVDVHIGNTNVGGLADPAWSYVEGFKLHDDIKPGFRDYLTRR